MIKVLKKRIIMTFTKTYSSLLFATLLLIMPANLLLSKDFSFDFLKGINIGLSNKRIIEILDSNKMEYTIEKNDIGGKYFLVKYSVFFQEVEFNEIRIPLLKNKSDFILMMTNDYTNILKSIDLLSKDANCFDKSDEKPIHYFFYDKHLVTLNLNMNYMSINKSKKKCK